MMLFDDKQSSLSQDKAGSNDIVGKVPIHRNSHQFSLKIGPDSNIILKRLDVASFVIHHDTTHRRFPWIPPEQQYVLR